MKSRRLWHLLLLVSCLLTGLSGWNFGRKPASGKPVVSIEISQKTNSAAMPATAPESQETPPKADYEQFKTEFLAYAKDLPREDPKLSGMALELFRLKSTATLDLILQSCHGLQRRNLLWSLLEQWCEFDHLGPWRWITTANLGEQLCSDLTNPITTVAGVYGRVDGPGALQAWLSLPANLPFPDYASEVLCLHAVAKDNRTQAITDILAQPSSTRLNHGLTGIFIMFTQNEGLAAAGQWWDEQTTLDATTRRHLSRVIAKAAAANDPQAALTWLMPRSSAETMGEDFQGIVGEWADTQPEACSAWVQQIPRGLQRDYCLDELLPALSNEAPEMALQAADLFANESRRRSESWKAWMCWLNISPQAATAGWSRLTAEQQEWLKLP